MARSRDSLSSTGADWTPTGQETEGVPSTDPVAAPTRVFSNIHPDDPDDEWAVAETGRTLKVRALTGTLVLLIVLAGGFWGGVVAEKHHGGTKATTASGLAAAFRGLSGRTGTGTTGTGASGFTGAGAGGSATTGTVVGVSGNTLEISDSNGNLVKVTLSAGATVTRTTAAKLGDLQVGDTVVIAGAAGANGVVSATSVRATAQGVTAGGFAGGGGFSGAPAGG